MEFGVRVGDLECRGVLFCFHDVRETVRVCMEEKEEERERKQLGREEGIGARGHCTAG